MADVNLTVYTTPYTVQVPVGACAGVSSINGLSGTIGLSGNNITITNVGNTLVFSGTPISSYVSSFNGKTGDVQGVCAINGLTGVINYVARTNVGQTFTGLQEFLTGICLGGFTAMKSPHLGFTGNVLLPIYADGGTYKGNAPGILLKYKSDVDEYGYLAMSSNLSSLVIGNTSYNAYLGTNTTIVGYDNLKEGNNLKNYVTIFGSNNAKFPGVFNSPTATLNTVIVGNNNLTSTTIQDASNSNLIGNNIAPLISTTLNNSTLIGDRILSYFPNTIQENVLIGSQVGSNLTGEDNSNSIQNVLIGSQILANSAYLPYSSSNNVIIGYKAANIVPSYTSLNNSIIIGPAYVGGPNFSKNVTIQPNPNLGDNQLIIGSGFTAWITGSCAAYVGIGGVTTPQANLHVRNTFVLNPSSPPATSTSPGVTGSIAWDNNYIYVCAAGNSWRRAPISSW